MKKVIYTALLVTGLSVSTYAADDYRYSKEARVTSNAQAQFNDLYAKATNVNWEVTEKFQKAFFILDGVTMTAFYNLNGEHIATTQPGKVEQLSETALARIAKAYKGYEIGKVIEYNNTSTVYFVELKKGEREVLVRVTPDNSVYFFKQIK
ncbi:hypothetical protein AHMF7605_18710 [Adhaeribacter arboris]|uniref:Beta-lactamase-inhibitor-like PepSY-like domain-containing protein n=1 Tax=Adhaeribacter arboris TaxID=2072846 RepID=A0A2T2YIR1_9BACT|nr:hypothetical protein [Adhaeribacter arboris]PSR55391.1 hypothetical protein AHMF7605_18710 [Adhaeribacter arboris]